MKWQEEGILLSMMPFGEKSYIAWALTRDHGRHKGIYKSSRQQLTFMSGTVVMANWHARLEDHLGMWRFETVFAPLAHILSHPTALSALAAAIALVDTVLPEREPQPLCYPAFKEFILSLQLQEWLINYVRLELALVSHSGFPLDLTRCVVTGQTHELKYVSPKSGKAVSKEIGLPYHDRLLRLPEFLSGKQGAASIAEILDALDLTEYFLGRYSLGIHGQTMPAARVRFKEHLKIQQIRKQDASISKN